MTVTEIHIGLGILLQKVNTHKSKNFLYQELDMLFNLTLNNYKNKKTDLTSNPKQVSIFDTHTSLDNLSTLFETVTLYPITTNEEEATILLPFDFYGWINASANIAYNCAGSFEPDVVQHFYKEAFLYNLKNINLTTLTDFIINIEYETKQGTSKVVKVFDYKDLPADYLPQDGIKDYVRSFIFINAIVKVINLKLVAINEDTDNKIYVKYDNKLEALVICSTNFLITTISTNAVNYNFIYKAQTNKKIKLINKLQSPVAISDTEYEPYINNSHLSKSRDTELRAVRTSEVVKVKIPKSVILSSVTLTYVRLPRQIDYLLGIGSDLPDDIVTKIMADTAQLIKGIIATDSYDKFARENILIE